jgi:hypothetical protein
MTGASGGTVTAEVIAARASASVMPESTVVAMTVLSGTGPRPTADAGVATSANAAHSTRTIAIRERTSDDFIGASMSDAGTCRPTVYGPTRPGVTRERVWTAPRVSS